MSTNDESSSEAREREADTGTPESEVSADQPADDTDQQSSLDEQVTALTRQAARAADQQSEPLVRQWLLLLPRLVRFLWCVSRSDEVDTAWKAKCLMVIAYILSPVDLIPDWVPVVGLADDLYLALMLLDRLVNRLPTRVFDSCWQGDRDAIDQVRGALAFVEELVPAGVRSTLDSFFGESQTADED